VIDIALQAVAGRTPFTPQFNVFPNNALGDGVDQPDVAYWSAFPYAGTPSVGYAHPHHQYQKPLGVGPGCTPDK